MVFSYGYGWERNWRQHQKMLAISLAMRSGGAMWGASPNGANPRLHSKPPDAAIGWVLALHHRGGCHDGRRFWSKTQNTNKKLFLASQPMVDWKPKTMRISYPELVPLISSSMQLKLCLNVKCHNWSWRACKHFYDSNSVSGQKLKMVSSDHKAR